METLVLSSSMSGESKDLFSMDYLRHQLTLHITYITVVYLKKIYISCSSTMQDGFVAVFLTYY